MKVIRFFRRGSTFISYTVSLIIILAVFIEVLSLYIISTTYMALDMVVTEASRDVVVCSTKLNAQQAATEAISEAIAGLGFVDESKTIVYVEYANGSEAEWTKGNYLEVNAYFYIETLEPFTTGYYNISAVRMIESKGD